MSKFIFIQKKNSEIVFHFALKQNFTMKSKRKKVDVILWNHSEWTVEWVEMWCWCWWWWHPIFFWKKSNRLLSKRNSKLKKKIGGVEIVDFFAIFFCFFIHFYIDFFLINNLCTVYMVEIEIFIDTLFHHCRSISSEDKCVCMQMIEYWLIDW